MNSNEKRFNDGYKPSQNIINEGYTPKPISNDKGYNPQNGHQPEKSQNNPEVKPVPPKKE
ncbi:hypothetical protein ACOL20_04410 [Aliarcobacter butzleri]|uniref:hypothetical protein n=1 Tax=Aliarcobacter butzleri TaxID=28197 RepID=UPI00263F0808|nr:hypothetical protein [Aliarcobacter butzleri]MDN5043128.1 hypothetical protein [Aliarcobacter butzleri]